jgi:hypothetical protein
VYDMYPWDGSTNPGGRPPRTPPARGDATFPHNPPGAPHAGHTRAVQVALDRRDNGGDAAAAPGAPAAGPARQ